MKKVVCIAFLLLWISSTTTLMAQAPNSVLMTVGGEQVTTSEFLSVYAKNNTRNDAMDRASLEEYLDLYINFKLKVKEAEDLGLDTAATFKNELAGYRKQLTQPYLTDKVMEEELLREAWERSKYDLRASHILVKVNKNAPPADTLVAYAKIMNLRKRILKGEDFSKIAAEASEDDGARDRTDPATGRPVKGNNGDLGYFTALDMIYPFETAVYGLNVGEVSHPVRTDNGYHLIKLTAKSPALGKLTVAHIFINVAKDISDENAVKLKAKIDEAYAKLLAGEKWEDVVTQYSDDKGSAAKGGQLPSFGVNQIVPEFIEAIAKISDIGGYSQPVKTMFGWHIIKLIDKKATRTFDEDKAALKNRLIRDKRMAKCKESVINRVKGENSFSENKAALADFYTVVDTSIFSGKWTAERAVSLSKTMFTLGNKAYTQRDFAEWLAQHQARKAGDNPAVYVNEKYQAYVDEIALALEDSRLESKYPEFKTLMKEYRDGILLFELTDQKVWSRAIKDTSGLSAFHERNKNKYMWDERLDASIYTCTNASVAKMARKLAKAQDKKKLTDVDILKKINTDSIPALRIQSKYFLHKENSLIDNVPWSKAITPDQVIDSSVVFVVVRGVVQPTPKSLREAKGMITADYQNELEKEWIEQLRKKYPVNVNRDVFESLITTK